jgi:V/A-type H+-transporting ATPase subunit I
MIVEMKKFLIYGAKDQMDRFFATAQQAGFLEFIGIWHKKALEMPQHIKFLLSAIKILRTWVGSEEKSEEDFSSNAVILSERIVQLNESLERLKEKQRLLTIEITRIAPFGDFSSNDVAELEKSGRRILQFFCMKNNLARDISLPNEMIWVASEGDLDYYVAVNEERQQYPKMIEIQIPAPLGELNDSIQQVRSRIAMIEAELKKLSSYLVFLQEALIDNLNDHHLQAAKHDAYFPMGDAIFAIEAWVPSTRVKELTELLAPLSVYCEPIAIDSHDRVPTCMENSANAKIGEDLVKIYDTPSIHDKDPSSWVLIFFSIFFAMIISDAGYGFFYLALGLFLKWKFPQISGRGKRLVKLTLILACTTIAWGMLISSYFAIRINPESSVMRFSLLHYLTEKKADYIFRAKDNAYSEYIHRYPAAIGAENSHEFLAKAVIVDAQKVVSTAAEEISDGLMMEFSLLMGILHLTLAFFRYLRRHWAGAGWIAFMIGGYLFFPASVLNTATLANVLGWVSISNAHELGKILVFGGFGLAIFMALIQFGVKKALLEAFHVSQIFGDVLSYLRLYALGLAGSLMASTFNSVGADLGLVAGIFVIAIGHLANIGISVMAGTIHGLRLNFLEWYHFCFEGGGKLFHPLRLGKPKAT